jgi:ribosomal protein S18 acetylase RimI-like enzyme
MESFFGTGFADVRVHVGNQAPSIGALAFTHGSNLYFAPGQYNPHTTHGQKLLGHELTHVMQQRAGRVKNPFGAGVAVVQDHGLEAEADRMGQRAAAHAHTVQGKPGPVAPPPAPRRAAYVVTRSARGSIPGTVQRSAPTQVSGMMPLGHGSYRISVGAGGHEVGSVMVHDRGKAAIEVTDLAVDPAFRKQGLGGVLMASAARAGLQLRKAKVTLASQDNGTGRLTAWYKKMGFAPTGANRRGYPVLEAPISRALSGVAQGRMRAAHLPQMQPNAVAPRHSNRTALGSEKALLTRSDRLTPTKGSFTARRRVLPRTIQRFVGGVIQRMQGHPCPVCQQPATGNADELCDTCQIRAVATEIAVERLYPILNGPTGLQDKLAIQGVIDELTDATPLRWKDAEELVTLLIQNPGDIERMYLVQIADKAFDKLADLEESLRGPQNPKKPPG